MTREIFVALSTFSEHGREPFELLEKSGFSFSINRLGHRLKKEEIIDLGKTADGIIAGVETYDGFVLDQLPKLRCISRCGVGLDNIDLTKAKEKSIVIVNTPNVVIQPVVELTIAMIFDLLRGLTHHTTLLKAQKWEKKTGFLLAGKTVGVVGLGRIGKQVAKTLTTLGAQVMGTDLNLDNQWAQTYGITLTTLSELLEKSDIITLHLSSDLNNPFQIGASEISKMKKGAYLINVSRGQFIEENALYHALKENRLRGAALDVFSEEPYKGKLLELENILLTPHIATLTHESRLQMEVEAVQNMIRTLNSL